MIHGFQALKMKSHLHYQIIKVTLTKSYTKRRDLLLQGSLFNAEGQMQCPSMCLHFAVSYCNVSVIF